MMNAKDIVNAGLFETAVNMMDDGLREKVHNAIAPCTEIEFLSLYMALHEDTFHEVFTI